MDLKHVRTFVAVIEYGTISAAAAELRIAQPALSRRIAALEVELGLPLFERNGRRLKVNKAGRLLLRQCRALLRNAEALLAAAKTLRDVDNAKRQVAAGNSEPKRNKAVRNGKQFPGSVSRRANERADRAIGRLGGASPTGPSIAVLPFQDLSRDSDQRFLGLGLAEDIITDLSRLPWLFVSSRSSSLAYDEKRVDAHKVARELGVRYLLQGRVRRAGKQVRVTSQLLDATAGENIWAGRYDRALTDIFALQDEITRAITDAIGPAITDTEQHRVMRKDPDSLSAWEAYHRGLWHVSKNNASQNRVAQRFFQRAIRLDSNFSLAHAALSATYLREAHVYNTTPLSHGIQRAEPLARKAIALDAADAGARALLAVILFLKGNHDAAIEEANYGLMLNQNCWDAMAAKGIAMVFSGRGKQGRKLIHRYLEANPNSIDRPLRLSQLAASYYFDRQYEKAATTAQLAFRQHPGYSNAIRWLAASLGQMGRTQDASVALNILLKGSPGNLEQFAKVRPPMIRAADFYHMIEGLRKAGWMG